MLARFTRHVKPANKHGFERVKNLQNRLIYDRFGWFVGIYAEIKKTANKILKFVGKNQEARKYANNISKTRCDTRKLLKKL